MLPPWLSSSYGYKVTEVTDGMRWTWLALMYQYRPAPTQRKFLLCFMICLWPCLSTKNIYIYIYAAICIYKIYLNIFTLFVCLHLPDISLPIFLIFNHMSLFFHKYISCEPYFVVIPSLRVLYVITDRFNIFTFIIFCYTGFVFLLLPYFGL